MSLSYREVPASLRRRVGWALLAALLGFGGLLARLWFLQVLQGEEMRLSSETNRIRLTRVQATRGTVVDRHGRVLVDSRPSFDALVVPEDSPSLGETVSHLAGFLDADPDELLGLLKGSGRRRFQPVVVRRDLSFDQMAAIETHLPDVPGVSLRITPRRSYPLGSVLSHLLGYVGEASPEDVASGGYRLGDMVGKTGLERRWEEHLRGESGGQQIEVDSVGRKLRVLREVEEVPGAVVRLSIDLDLQKAATEYLGERDGSLVVLDPRNGEILALVNHPGFDPNLFARGVRASEWRELVTDKSRPITNRAIQGQYPPGSTFKFIVVAAALEEGIVTPSTRVHCPGGLKFGNHYFRCWRRGGHGSVDAHEALVQSCDTYFYSIAQRMGVDMIADYARLFGLGRLTGIDLEHEKAGTIPDTAWKQRRFGQPWYAGETLSVSIGQGYVTATPLQMANAVAMMATGRRYRPRFVLDAETVDGDVLHREEPEETGTLRMRASTLAVIRNALRDVVATQRGSGRKANLKNVEVAGKTGTSQVVKFGKERLRPDQQPRHHRDHAWFVAYAPAHRPEVAVAAIVEHADGGGGAIAAPLVGKVIEKYFRLRQQRKGGAGAAG